MRAAAVWLAGATVLTAACDGGRGCGGGADAAEAAATESSEGSGDAAGAAATRASEGSGVPATDEAAVEGSHDAARALPAGRLWFGVRCSSFDGGRRELAVFVDGAEVQRIDAQCPAAGARDRPPDAQFTIVSESGVRAIRLHDLKSNFIADEQVAVSGDTWTVISYHVLDDASAAATIDAQYTRPDHAAQ